MKSPKFVIGSSNGEYLVHARKKYFAKVLLLALQAAVVMFCSKRFVLNESLSDSIFAICINILKKAVTRLYVLTHIEGL